MIQNYSRYRILQEFFDYPRKHFHMRELSRRVKLAHVSIINHLQALVKEGFVIKEKKEIYSTFRANRENKEFKTLKRQNLLWRIEKSGLIAYIDDAVRPNCIVLFGSGARGEDTEESDIDLFVQAEESNLEVRRFERLLHRKINIFFEADLHSLNKELLNNIINGQVIDGYLQVF